MNQPQPTPELFSTSLPIVTETAPRQPHGTILLVEDETFLLDVTCQILESAGYRVLKTRNAEEALSTFQQYKAVVRLLLTDVVLPGRNGRDLANQLRSISPNLQVIFISGYPENAVTRSGIQEDGLSYLPKPYSLQSLTCKVRQVLEQEQTENKPPVPGGPTLDAGRRGLKNLFIAPLLLFSLCSLASTIVTQVAHIANYGGWGLIINVGANKGDVITLDVKCNRDEAGQCFIGTPKLQSGSSFVLVKNEFRHQQWTIASPTTGDQVVNAAYYWVGTGVNYEITVVSTENL